MGRCANCQSQNARKAFKTFCALLRWCRGFQLAHAALHKRQAGLTQFGRQVGRPGVPIRQRWRRGERHRQRLRCRLSLTPGAGALTGWWELFDAGHGFLVSLPQRRVGAGRVDLGGADLRMPQQLAQAGDGHARFGDLASKGVPQLMRGDRDAGLGAIAMQQPLDAVGRERLAAVIEKDLWLSTGWPHRQPARQHGIRVGAEQYQTFLLPFATDAQPGWLVGRGRRSHVSELEGGDFAHPQAGPPHQRKPRLIARGRDDRPQLRDGFVTQVPRQTMRLFAGMPLETHRVGLAEFAALLGQEVKVHLERRHAPFHGRRPETRAL